MASAQDFLVAKFGLEASLLTKDDLQHCLRDQQELAERGQAIPLVQVLVRRRLVTSAQLVVLMKAIEATSFECARCRVQIPYARIGPASPLACARCRGPLTARREDGEAVSERLVTGRAARERGAVSPRETRVDAWNQGASGSLGAPVTPPPSASVPGRGGSAPKTFGPYEILAELGRGGMGVVYKARHPALDKVVALKVLIAGDMASRTQVKRFQREAELAGKLKHPGIVPIHDVGEIADRHYFTMDFIEGRALDVLVKAREVQVRQSIEIARDLARALGYAHSMGVLHRDVKPANIIIDATGRPLIMDFGLARDLQDDESSRLTREGAAVGTPYYMSPEQTAGDRASLGPGSDIYSLGVVLYEMLTFELPFEAKTQIDLTRLILNQPAPAPSSIEPAIDPDVDSIVLKTLEKDPSLRYETAFDLADDLDRWLRGEPIRARPAGFANRLLARLRRQRARLVPALLLSAALAAGGVGTGLIVRRLHRIEAERKATEDAAAKAAAAAAAEARREAARREATRAHDESQRTLREAEAAFAEADRVPAAANEAFLEKLNRAVALATDSIQGAPEEARAWLLRARAREAARQPDLALEDYAKAAALDPRGTAGAEATYRQARLEVRHKRDEASARKLLAALGTREEAGGIWWRLGRASALLLGEHPDAEAVLSEVEAARKLDPTCPDVYFVKALGCMRDGPSARPQDALEALNTCLEGERKNARAYALRARIAATLGRADAAQDDLGHAFALDPDDPLALLTRSQLRAQVGRLPEAIQDLEKVLKQQAPGEDLELLLACARLHASAGQLDGAKTWAARAVARAPENPVPYQLLAQCYADHDFLDLALKELRSGIAACASSEAAVGLLAATGVELLVRARQFDEAEAFARAHLGVKPEEPGRLLLLARALALRRPAPDTVVAIQLLDQIHAKAPRNLEAFDLHFRLLMRGDDASKVEELAARLLAAAPRDPEALGLLAGCYEALGDRRRALETAGRAVELDSSSAGAWAHLAYLELASGDLEHAEKHAQTAVEHDRSNPRALTVLGTISLKRGHPQEGVNFLKSALDADPGEPEAARLLATVLYQDGRADLAARIAETALARSPGGESPPLLEVLGLSLLEGGRVADAATVLERLVALAPGVATGHAALGAAYMRLGKVDGARAELTRALALDPGDAQAKELLRILDQRQATSGKGG